MEVVSSESSSTFGTLSEARVVATSNTFRAEDMETLCEDCIFLPCTATRAVQFGLEERVSTELEEQHTMASTHLICTYFFK